MSASQTDQGSRVGDAANVAARFKLTPPAKPLLQQGQSVPEFTEALLAAGCFPDAVRLVAHALPTRESIWWACQCARQVVDLGAIPEQEVAIQAAEKWVTEMTDETRRWALPVANDAGAGTAAGCAALAVFYSGDSLTAPDAPPVLPPPHQSALLVAGSIMLSALHEDTTKAPERYRTFVGEGLDLLRSLNSGESS